MTSTPPPTSLLEELDARQDVVLAQLDALNIRIEQVLKDFTVVRPDEAKAA